MLADAVSQTLIGTGDFEMSEKGILALLRDAVLKPVETMPLNRLLSRLDEVLAAIEAMQVADKITPTQALIRVEWRVALFPFEQLAALQRSAPGALREEIDAIEGELRKCLGEVRASALEGKSAQVLEARTQLLAQRARLEALTGRLQSGAWHTRMMRSAFALSGVAAVLSAAYLRSDLGMKLERVEALSPPAAYHAITTSDSELVPQDDYLNDYMLEFSKSYFEHESAFFSLYFDKTKDGSATQRRTLQHKLSLRNASHGQVQYISSVEAVAEALGEAEFPWRRLTVTPRVTAEMSTPGDLSTLIFKSDGIGPAIDLTWEWRAQSGLVLSTGTFPWYLNAENRLLSALRVGMREERAGTLTAPLYFKLKQPPPATDASRYLQVGPGQVVDKAALPKDCRPAPPEQYGWYQIISTVAMLREVTKVAYDEPWTLQLRYSALNSAQESTFSLTGQLGKGRAFYPFADGLYENDPRCADTDRDGIVDPGSSWPVEKLALAFADEKAVVQPKGVDLLTARLGIDLWKLPSGRRSAATTELDGFLNPQGILAVYLTLNMPDRLRYQVTVRVNGRPAATYRFAGLVPEHFSFHEEGEARAVARLRKVFGVSTDKDKDQGKDKGKDAK